MGTPAPETPPTGTAEQAAETEATQQAAAGSTPAQAKPAAADAAQAARPELSDAEAERIASKTIEQLEARGVFDHDEPAAPAPPPPAEQPRPGDQPPGPENSEQPPTKKSLAAKFMGL